MSAIRLKITPAMLPVGEEQAMTLDDDAVRVAGMGRLSIRRALLTGRFIRAAGPALGATAAALRATVARE